jgi:hypothetical protein
MSPHKTAIVPLTNRRKIEDLRISHPFMIRNFKCWVRLSIWR